jgi:catechol 2,3-dioxygenase-like lactoylglutathione lyase family enzyme
VKISGAATVLPVNDVERSICFFVDVLGFSEEFRLPNYAGVERGGAIIHLSHHTNPNTAKPGSGGVYIFCDEVDGYYQEIIARGAVVHAPPNNYSYGMRDFVVHDPDDNRITFGCEVKQAPATAAGD